MKLIELDMIGFGPFAKRTKIDFQPFQAAPILLIHGRTGAGKTSVLDAITYAFYGRASGMDGRTPDTLRSQMIEDTEETEVQLVFEIGGNRYRVGRSPEYMRRKKRGDGWVKESPKAIFEAWESDHWVPKVTRTQGVNQAIEEKLGFSYEQFTQVLILPQGKFRQMLIADSSQRRDIFRQLFRTGEMEWIQLRLREDTAKMRKEIETRKIRLEELFGQIQSIKTAVDAEGEMDSLELVRAQVEDRRHHLNDLEDELVRDRATLKGNRALRDLAIQAERVRKELASWEKQQGILVEKRQEIEALMVVRDRGETALGIQKNKEALANEMMRKKEVEIRLQAVQSEFEEIREKRKTLLTQNVIQQSIEDVQRRLRARKEREGLEERFVKNQIKSRTLREKMEESKEKMLVHERRKNEADKNLNLVLDTIKQEKAYHLAKDLEADQPCPVCGSLHHPNVAKPKAIDPAEEALAQRKVRDSELALGRVKEDQHALIEQIAKCQGQEEGIQIQLNGLEDSGLESVAELEAEEGLCQQKMKMVRVMDEKWARIKGQVEAIELQLKKLTEEVMRLQHGWDEALKASGFATVAAYEEAEQSYGALQKMNREVQQYQLDLAEANRKVGLLREEAKTKFSQPISVVEQEAIVEEWTRVVEEKARILTEKTARWKNEQQILARLETASAELERIEAEFGSLAWMSDVASGRNAKGMDFEQYVLRRYLQEVLLVANQRLQVLTDGRFELHMQEERRDKRKRFGLDLDVFDFYTGDRRPVGSLSGGESFKASLALALALSDVVRAFSGGIELETLFIDEGFGTLDPSSLDQAVEVLVDLKQQNRLVGIISHVPELKERIDNRIEVVKNKGKQGSRIRIHLPGGGEYEAMPVSNE